MVNFAKAIIFDIADMICEYQFNILILLNGYLVPPARGLNTGLHSCVGLLVRQGYIAL